MQQLIRMVLSFLFLLPAQLAFGCGVVAEAPLFQRVGLAGGDDADVTVTFVGHASFLIATPGHVTAVTDYNGVNIPSFPPDIATMNHAHSTHYTDHPDPRIPHVLHGWRDDGKPARIDLTVGDMHVTNLPTNIRDGNGGTEQYGNSIFIFQTAGLCIAHLSHLHHLLTADDLAALGQIDVVMAPVDGMYTLSHEDMAKVLADLHPRLVLPMHYFSQEILDRFLNLERDHYRIVVSKSATTTISAATLPDQPEIRVLPGPYF